MKAHGTRSAAIVIGTLALACTLPARAAIVSVMEFYHVGFDHFFMTSFPAEAAILDAGTSIVGWSRTENEFRVDNTPGPGRVEVCRFFSTSFAPKSSHFYTADANECEIVKQNPDWQFEGIAFYVYPPSSNGECVTGLTPVYRFYNNGQSGAPNHKYMPRRADRQYYLDHGYVPEGLGPEGVVFCVPVAFGVAEARTTAFANSQWRFTLGAPPTATFEITYGPVEETGDPERPYGTQSTSLAGFAAWDPYAAKIISLLFFGNAFVALRFDYTGGNTVQGCALVVTDPDAATLGPCISMIGQRL